MEMGMCAVVPDSCVRLHHALVDAHSHGDTATNVYAFPYNPADGDARTGRYRLAGGDSRDGEAQSQRPP